MLNHCPSRVLTDFPSLIAIMLGRLEMDADECIAAYSELMKEVFAERLSRFPFGLTAKTKARFDSAKLESAIKAMIRTRGIPENKLFNDKPDCGCKVFVIDYPTENN